MSATSTLKHWLVVGLVACVFAAACSGDGGRGDEPAVSDTSIADTTTTTTTTESLAEPSTHTETELTTTTTTEGVEEPSITAEADSTTTSSEPVVVTETTAPATTEPTTDPPTTSEPVVVTTPPSTPPSTESTTPADTTTTASTTTISAELENSRNVVCAEGRVKLVEFVTETDNGCRWADCSGGRDAQGWCRSFGDWLDTLVRDCPTVDTSDGLGVYGGDIFIDDGPGGNPIIWSEPADPVFPQMVPGSSWVAHIELVDNHNWNWKEGGVEPTNQRPYFIVSVALGGYVPRVGEEQKQTGGNILTSDDPEGSWTVPFTISANHPPERVFGFGAKAIGAGCWAVRFERTG